ncbi:MAG: redoxin domain-containing protein [Planctomycetes bacterium]|nr:redoxin domain-containing protein [Planctomycetota bacterium]
MRDQFAEFEKLGVAVLGVSFDDRAANAAFRGQHELPFPLLCDAGHELAIAYGAADAAARMPKRKAVLIEMHIAALSGRDVHEVPGKERIGQREVAVDARCRECFAVEVHAFFEIAAFGDRPISGQRVMTNIRNGQ